MLRITAVTDMGRHIIQPSLPPQPPLRHTSWSSTSQPIHGVSDRDPAARLTSRLVRMLGGAWTREKVPIWLYCDRMAQHDRDQDTITSDDIQLRCYLRRTYIDTSHFGVVRKAETVTLTLTD